MFNRIKGTQDFLDLSLFNFLIDAIRKHLEKYMFIEISTPILESTELFKRSLGLETDVVTKEMYTLNTGPDSESICLRPEATASTVRAFLDAGIQVTPWKVFSYGPMFRHERPQKGRYRQFHQINLEIIGSLSIYQDAQFIKMLEKFFSDVLKLDEYALHLNFLGCAQDRATAKRELEAFLNTVISELCATCIIRKEKNILRVYDCKIPACQELYKKAPEIADSLCQVCQLEWVTLKQELEHLSISYSYVPTLVRGLDYYDKTVFEFVSMHLGAQNAFCGGGRYHQLATLLGARQDYPSIGAAIGIERLLIMLENKKDILQLPTKPPVYVIAPLSQEQNSIALLVANELQNNDLCAEILLEGASLKSMLRTANRLGARATIIIGSEEQNERCAIVKNMITGKEDKVLQRDIAEFLRQ